MTFKIYFGAPLFNEMEQMYNAYVVNKIRETYGEKVEIYLPQENASINDKSGFADSIAIAQGDNAYLEDADLLIAVLDGVTPDSGLSAELGYFYSLERPIFGLYTDTRQGTHGNQQKIAALDEIAWTLNLRGTDIHCNPLFVSYLFITMNDCTLYINKEANPYECCY